MPMRRLAVARLAIAGIAAPKDAEMNVFKNTPRQRRTRQLTDGAGELFTRSLTLMKLPLLRPMRKRVATLLADAGLVPDAADIARHQAMEGAADGIDQEVL